MKGADMPLEQGLGRCPVNVHAKHARNFEKRLRAFKTLHELIDFPGMIEQVVAQDLRPDVQVAFIDEAQDLSPLQIAAVEAWFGDCDRVYVGLRSCSPSSSVS